jgi:hypothetical protein
MFSDAEKQEIKSEIEYLKFILTFHNEEAEKGNLLYGMTEDESLNHRLDVMEKIVELEQMLKEE